jgi:hypothetical protein
MIVYGAVAVSLIVLVAGSLLGAIGSDSMGLSDCLRALAGFLDRLCTALYSCHCLPVCLVHCGVCASLWSFGRQSVVRLCLAIGVRLVWVCLLDRNGCRRGHCFGARVAVADR